MDEEHIFCCSVESEDFIWVFWNVLECLTQIFKWDIMCVGSTLQIYTWYFACLLSCYVWMPPKLWSISAFDWLVLNTCLIYMCLWLHVFLFVGEASAPTSADPIAMMEFYMKKAAQEEKFKQPKQSKDEMPPPASLQGPDLLGKRNFLWFPWRRFYLSLHWPTIFICNFGLPLCVFFLILCSPWTSLFSFQLLVTAASSKKGHHMGDYIPQDELEKFLAACNDAAAQKAAKEAAERAKIQADNVGHRLLSKMGWKEGASLSLSHTCHM